MNLNWSIVLFAAAAAISLVFALIQILSDKAKAIRAVVALAILGVVLLIAYNIASDAIPNFFGVEKFVDNETLTPSISKWVGTGLNVTYFLFGGAILSVIGFGAASIFKR